MSITLIFHLFVNFPPLQLHLFILLYYCILKWNRILSLREGFFAYITSLTPPLFIEVHVPSQESKQSSIDVVSFNDFDIRVVRQCGILELFRQCGILELFRQCGILELFRQCGIFVFIFHFIIILFNCFQNRFIL